MNWNHNIHYHELVMSAISPRCRRALDVGCGRGELAQKLARQADEVFAIDVDRECLAFAKAVPGGEANITFVQGSVLEHPLPEGSFDLVVAMASLHHLPLREALERFRKLLRPGGILIVVGLYRAVTHIDHAIDAIALPISWAIRSLKGTQKVGAPALGAPPLKDPAETLRDIRTECESSLPGGVLRRRLFFRYSFIWQKP